LAAVELLLVIAKLVSCSPSHKNYIFIAHNFLNFSAHVLSRDIRSNMALLSRTRVRPFLSRRHSWLRLCRVRLDVLPLLPLNLNLLLAN